MLFLGPHPESLSAPDGGPADRNTSRIISCFTLRGGAVLLFCFIRLHATTSAAFFKNSSAAHSLIADRFYTKLKTEPSCAIFLHY